MTAIALPSSVLPENQSFQAGWTPSRFPSRTKTTIQTTTGCSLEVDSPRQPRHDRAALQEVTMLVPVRLTLALAIFGSAMALPGFAQEETEPQPGHTMRPVIIGRQYAVSSMKHQATEAAVRILEAGGNAFDAAVAGQAVLALVDPASNEHGSDAVVLVYDAKSKKVVSINAEGTAAKLATIDWA
jgi:hypothetical protein